MADLRVTIRSLSDDLGLVDADVDDPNADLERQHEVLRAFFQRRSQMPTGSETTQLPLSSQTVYNLHAGRHRALTWHDEADDVVWLLGAGWHESGSIDDAYEVLKRLDASGRLLPTEDDYVRLYQWRKTRGVSDLAGIVEDASIMGPELLANALASPGVTCEITLGGVLDVSVVASHTAGPGTTIQTIRVSVRMPPRHPGVLPSNGAWETLIVPAFLPADANTSLLKWSWDEGFVAEHEGFLYE